MKKNKLYLLILSVLTVVLIFKFSSIYVYTNYIKEPEKKYDTFGFFERKSNGVPVKRPEGDGYELRSSNQKDGSGGTAQANTNKPLSSLSGAYDGMLSATKSGLIPALILLLGISIFFYRRRSRKNTQQSTQIFDEVMNDLSVHQSNESGQPGTPLSNSTFGSETQLRQMMRAFNDALSSKQKRQHQESLTEWFERIQFISSSRIIYDAHRYGSLAKEDITRTEVEQLERDMKTFLGG
ncbi:hypothetical protein [Exiguobacterium sp. S22-S28]|uniref:hypothetical protein n=1 Tax=Exiguobacterium sp. S22-S28 TaxID=3342768 RepID=UPI00372D52F8